MMSAGTLDPIENINMIINPDEMKVDIPYRVDFLNGIWKAVRHDSCTIVISQLDLSKEMDKKLAKKLPKAPIKKKENAS